MAAANAKDLYQCPASGLPLAAVSNDRLVTETGISYGVSQGIARLLPDAGFAGGVQDHYEQFGWDTDNTGEFAETKAYVDVRSASIQFTHRCIRRLKKYFKKGGQYILDAGCGPIPHQDLLSYSERFDTRICMDLSSKALQICQSKIGDKGLYVQGDLTKLPFKTNSIDAITCNHVLYQVPPEKQETALLEMGRVLKPGGVGVIVYWWPYSAIARRLEPLAQRLGLERRHENEQQPIQDAPRFQHNKPHPRSWFEARDWPFNFSFESFRVVDNGFMSRYVPDDWRGRVFLEALYVGQALAPRLCGRYGSTPAFVIRKSPASAAGQ